MRSDWLVDHLALARSAADRDAQRRSDPGLLEALATDPATRLLLVDSRGRVALDASAHSPDPPEDGLAPPDAVGMGASVWEGYPGGTGFRLPDLSAKELDLEGLSTFYLGRDDREDGAGSRAGRRGWLAVVVPQGLEVPEAPGQPRGGTDAEGAATDHPDLRRVLGRHPLTALRATGAQMSVRDSGLAVTASALAAWHGSSRYCPACGARTMAVQAGWARRCSGCQAVHFPRTDPAVIMAVTDDADRLLLVHGASWEDRRYSVVAGFVEAGESLEAAVRREVWEETGLRVEDVSYLASQPWPFPRSLMLGYRARLAPGENLARPDGEEVTGAVLVSREELAQAVAQRRIVLPGRASLGRLLIEDWFRGAPPS
ncbi:NAD(+) diphosphatase [Actinomyces sp. 2119]|uniref:NAD(+) diphosphatase n=1 Tax=Actinomyces sp. 2119 TaxID=2321393 RepID=UPI000E6B9C87|nr:NAD(+) diphosphatase [Actinomyces sp. 2119]RJF41395.1 NAD(+) diphosphatase [Actinomyces sp. 2119]